MNITGTILANPHSDGTKLVDSVSTNTWNIVTNDSSHIVFSDTGKFNGKSLHLIDNKAYTDNLSATINDSEDFTLSLWAKKHGSIANLEPLICGISSSTTGYDYTLGVAYYWSEPPKTGFSAYDYGIPCFYMDTKPAANVDTWFHLAITRKSGIMYIFIDGELKYSGAQSFTITNGSLSLGLWGTLTNSISNIEYDDIMLIKEQALWTKTFDVPTTYLIDYIPATLKNKLLKQY